MPYRQFRARVYEIAQANLAEVRGAHVAEWDEIPDGELVLPVDDDDWFAPNAAEVLARVRAAEATAYVWEASFAEVPTWAGHRLYLARRKLAPWSPPKWACSTNSYAMEKRDGSRELLANHVRASRWVDGAPEGSVHFLDDRLSLINRSLASQTQLRRGERNSPARPGELRRKYAAYRRLYPRLARSGPAWTRPYLAMMGELMDELSPR